ncbi:MAG: glycosyl hydrolase, partial [Coraliomargarita sp.]
MSKKLYTLLLLTCSVLSQVVSADTLSSTFKQPSEDTKPWCYWYWIGGDITAEGITKDLENMAEVGIARAMIGNVDVGLKTNNGEPDPVELLSPEWRELKMHALSEANRVGVEITFFNCPGWSQSGGPWIKPEQSMRRVIWSEFESNGGAFKQKVRAKGVPGGGSQDIAVLAVPAIQGVTIEGERTEKQYIFSSNKAFTARSLSVTSELKGSLFAVQNGERKLVTKIDVTAAFPKTDFLTKEPQTISFPDVRAARFELDYEPTKSKRRKAPAVARATLSSVPKVAQAPNKQMGRMHPTPLPNWNSYIFKDTVEPQDKSVLVDSSKIIDLSDQLGADGVLTCTLPQGDWRILYFGMVTTGKTNDPAAPEARGLEVDKMSRDHTRHHFDAYVGSLYDQMTPEEKAAFKGITIDSYEVGSQNWTDGFAAEFEKRVGYNPIPLLPILTGTVIDGAKESDQFLWDLRRTVADMIAECYLGGLRDIANEHGLVLWCEPYGHWGFPGDFTIYGGYADQVGGEFWSKGSLGNIECRAASSIAHTYGKHRTYAEAFTSQLNLKDNPYSFKARGEQMFSDGVNHFVLHVYAHQPRDGGMPGKNPWFGTAFHRNTPWLNEAQSWINYLQRSHTMLQWGDPANDVLVYIGDFAPQMTGPPNPVPNGYQYDYVGSDAILRKLDVVDGQWVTYDENNPQRISASWPV